VRGCGHEDAGRQLVEKEGFFNKEKENRPKKGRGASAFKLALLCKFRSAPAAGGRCSVSSNTTVRMKKMGGGQKKIKKGRRSGP